MLALSKLTDLLSGNLTDQIAYEYLLKLSNEKPSAALLNELITNILQVNDLSLFEPFFAAAIQSSTRSADILDCCGTGGSGIAHYNISTMCAFILAAGGVKVAKFGNRAASGTSGSFDFLEYLSLPIITSPSNLLEILQITDLVFLFAPQFYPGLAKLAPIRKAVGKPTVFNLIGPFLNPFCPTFRVLGTTTSEAQQAIADYLSEYTFLNKKCKKALIVRADSGLDELDPSSHNIIFTVDKLPLTEKASIEGASAGSFITESFLNLALDKKNSSTQPMTPQENARLFKEIISNFPASPDYFRALVTLNAGAGFYVAGKVCSIEEGQRLATNLLLSGKVLAKYEECWSVYAKYAS